MKTKITLISVFVILVMMASGQRPAFELAFTAENNGTYVQLDSIKIMNRTQGGDTVLVYPDTVLVIEYVGIPENQNNSEGFSIQAYPNPVADYTTLSLFIPENDVVRIRVTDLMGRQLISHRQQLFKGIHIFTFTPGGENFYLVTAEWKGYCKTVRIVNLSKSPGRTCSLSYEGFDEIKGQVKTMKAIRLFEYNPGDELLYIGYADTLQSGMLDVPEESETYTFQYATNIPCPGMPTVEYEGQVYNTIQVFSQCWLKENLNVGTMIPGNLDMTDDEIIEKYCFNDKPDSCDKYGGLYEWDEMMQYTTQQSVRGICPPGWYLPSDEEWKVMEGSVDKQFGIGDETWHGWGYRGYDAGKNLKTKNGWMFGGNGDDLFGFSGLPGGGLIPGYGFVAIGYEGDWWSSTEGGVGARSRYLNYASPRAGRTGQPKVNGISVRCLKDN